MSQPNKFKNIDATHAHQSASTANNESAQRFVPHDYRNHAISRRDTLKWFGLMAAGGLASIASAPSAHALTLQVDTPAQGHWPSLNLAPVSAKGYGSDPNLIVAPKNPWPKIMSVNELALTVKLCDIIVPREGATPSATELNVPEVINEWVSAPYAWQQSDRSTIMHLFAWLNDEANMRFQTSFTDSNREQCLDIVDDIAYLSEQTPPAFVLPAKAFARLRELILAAFFTTPEGMTDIGYMGNVPIAGDYPGPTKEAYAHLNEVLAQLGLSEYAYTVD